MRIFKENIEQPSNKLVETKSTGVLNEMAIPLKNYCERVESQRLVLVENWCLCRYCSLYDSENQNFTHWLGELKANIAYLKYVNIKKKVDKYRTLKRLLVDDYDYDSPEMIYQIAIDKFRREGITNPILIARACTGFSEGIIDLINAISIGTISIDIYTQNTFGKS